MRVVACSRYARPTFLRCLRKVKGSSRRASLTPILPVGVCTACNEGLFEWIAQAYIIGSCRCHHDKLTGPHPTPRKKSLVHREAMKQGTGLPRSTSQPQNPRSLFACFHQSHDPSSRPK
ncbi:hypothetical protein EI94DRAFT_264702 [Lactarius quietus]|nr:hypothetical protein EI94DRAFT_264702 [Lactarius quietus]